MKQLRVLLASLLLTLVQAVACLAWAGDGEPLRIEVNGVSLAYEVYGPADAKPVIVLHGNGSSHVKMEPLIKRIADAGYRVFGIDSRGQGANAPVAQAHYSDMAEDVFCFIQALGLDHPAVYGHSDGGILAILLEVMHPSCTSLIAASGANVTPDGVNEASLEKWRKKYEATGDPLLQMLLVEPQISVAQLGGIAVPALITGGSEDLIKEDHIRMIAASIPGSELYILKGEGHSTYINKKPHMATLLLGFMASREY